MTSLLIKFLSLWIPERRWSQWHCSGIELLFAFGLYIFLPFLTYHFVANSFYFANPEEQTPTDNENNVMTSLLKNQREDNSHPVLRLLQTKNRVVIGMAFYMACILAPLNEELLFRGCLQNWLQGLFTRLYIRRRRDNIRAGRWFISFMSVIIPAIIFALVHYRSNDVAKLTIEDIQKNILNCCVAWSLLPVILFLYFFVVRNLRFRDFFGTLRQTPGLIFSGVIWIWIMVPLFVLMIIVSIIQLIFGFHFVADPIGLFPLALVFGFLYYRTQSILPSVALHMLFNCTNLCLVLFFVSL